MTNEAASLTRSRVTGQTLVPTWFVAQTCRLREKAVRHGANEMGVATQVISHAQYDGPFQPQNLKDDGIHVVMKLSDARFLVRNKFGEKRVKWLQAGIDRICGRRAEGDDKTVTISNDDLLGIACAMDRLQLGVCKYSEVRDEVKTILWKAGMPWSKVPVDFKKKLRMMTPT